MWGLPVYHVPYATHCLVTPGLCSYSASEAQSGHSVSIQIRRKGPGCGSLHGHVLGVTSGAFRPNTAEAPSLRSGQACIIVMMQISDAILPQVAFVREGNETVEKLSSAARNCPPRIKNQELTTCTREKKWRFFEFFNSLKPLRNTASCNYSLIRHLPESRFQVSRRNSAEQTESPVNPWRLMGTNPKQWVPLTPGGISGPPASSNKLLDSGSLSHCVSVHVAGRKWRAEITGFRTRRPDPEIDFSFHPCFGRS